MTTFWRDVRYALRLLARSPGFTVVAMLTLALGIGATAAMFSIVHGALLRPLEYPDVDRIVSIELRSSRGFGPSYPAYQRWRAQAELFEELALYDSEFLTLTGAEEPQQLSAAAVTPGFFQVFGIQPSHGRTLAAGEQAASAAAVVILSESFWRRQFHSDPGVIGTTLRLDAELHTVVGVLDGGPLFRVPDIFVPLRLARAAAEPGRPLQLHVYGKLRPEATTALAENHLRAVQRQFEEAFALRDGNSTLEVRSLHEAATGHLRESLLHSWGAAGFVLLLACANVANLLLARAALRRGEMGVRMALGAGRGRILRQLLTEHVLLAVLGGAAGAVVAWWAFDLLKTFVPGVPGWREVGMSWPAFAFAFAASLLTGVLVGLAPALSATKLNLVETLKESGRQTGGQRRGWLRGSLVAGQFALALALLVGAGLLLRTLYRVSAVEWGFQPRGAYLVEYRRLPQPRYSDARARAAFFRNLLEQLEAAPGVEGAAVSSDAFVQGVQKRVLVSIGEGSGEERQATYSTISPGFFRAMGIPLAAGRAFTAHDGEGAAPVVIVSQTAAKTFWPGRSPLGQRIRLGSGATAREATVVGVAGDVVHAGFLRVQNSPLPHIYASYPQDPEEQLRAVVLRTPLAPVDSAGLVRNSQRRADPNLPAPVLRSIERRLSAWFRNEQRYATLLGSFAVLALLLSAVGVFGVMSAAVSRRRHEIGVRMALGAQRRDVLSLILRQGMLWVAGGVAAGAVAAVALTRLIRSALYGVTPTDPLTFAAAIVVLVLAGLAACYLPARRAARLHPMEVLRYE